MKSTGLFICFLFVLLGCGDDDNMSLALDDIAGVWNASTNENGLVDEKYIVITSLGDYIIYDYMGDTYQGEYNCYDKTPGTITSQGDNVFAVEGEYLEPATLEIELSNNQITLSDGSVTCVWGVSELEEYDFVPVCPSEGSLPSPW